MKSYQHINEQERELICLGIQGGKTKRQIAKELGRSHSSVVRELKRNRLYGRRPSTVVHPYLATHAQKKAVKRAYEQRRKAPLKNPAIFLYVREKLRQYWSPETIAGRLTVEHPDLRIHHETIYRYVYRPEIRRRYKMQKYLTLKRVTRRKQDGRSTNRLSKIPGAVSIDLRPKEVELRTVAGHWEQDHMGGKQSDIKAVSVNTERTTRYSLIDLLPNRTAITNATIIISNFQLLPRRLRLSLTQDNGAENTDHLRITANLEMPVYFCHPYHSWEKGTVENIIGRSRRIIPKGTSLDNLTHKQVEALQNWLNHTPRKCLSWQTPHEAFTRLLSIS